MLRSAGLAKDETTRPRCRWGCIPACVLQHFDTEANLICPVCDSSHFIWIGLQSYVSKWTTVSLLFAPVRRALSYCDTSAAGSAVCCSMCGRWPKCVTNFMFLKPLYYFFLLASALISFSAAVVSILSLANSCLISDIILSLCVFLT